MGESVVIVKIENEELQRRLNYIFKNKTLLQQALTHKSAHHLNNERLEFLGDSILNLIIAELLFQQFPTATEGELTRARASLVKKATLSMVANELNIGDYLHLGPGERRSGGFGRDSILADALEAIVGAIYLDGGFIACHQCVHHWFLSRLATLKPQQQEKDPKTRLQEWLQANGRSLPRYQIVSIVGEAHAQIFTVSCEIEGLSQVVQGTGSSRRFAEQQAAYKILECLNRADK